MSDGGSERQIPLPQPGDVQPGGGGIYNPLGQAMENTRKLLREAWLFDKVKFGTPEEMLRGFTSVDSTPKPRLPQEPPRERPESFFHWGRAAQFTATNFRDDALDLQRISVSESDDPTDPEPAKRFRYSLSEEGRRWVDIKVVNHEDADQYLIVRDLDKFALDTPWGQFLVENGHESEGDKQDQNQEPPLPPDLEHLNENQDWLDWWGRHHVGPPPGQGL